MASGLRVTLLGSGSPSPSLSNGADVLVVDACAVAPPPSLPPARRALIERLHGFHASPDECVSMAHRAGVDHVVLTHHLPDATPTFERGNYSGVVSIGEDLQSFEA